MAISNANKLIDFQNWTRNGNNIFYNDGNVGIGLSNPSYTLDVVGNINFTGNLTQNGLPAAGDFEESIETSFFMTGV